MNGSTFSNNCNCCALKLLSVLSSILFFSFSRIEFRISIVITSLTTFPFEVSLNTKSLSPVASSNTRSRFVLNFKFMVFVSNSLFLLSICSFIINLYRFSIVSGNTKASLLLICLPVSFKM